ncbi:MAG TPA: hypothetical protein VNG13_08395 [Mycobacteriales bacterium]|nr:hypothetical protein [Mycobacteriales bacterium]
MGLVLDSGALIAFDRGNRQVAALIEAARRRRERVVSSSGCVGQAWRGGGPRQARLARLLTGVDERPLDRAGSRGVGALCARARRDDVVDAHVCTLTRDGDVMLTSDVDDLGHLLRSQGTTAEIIRC